jgi:hypothetical protein
LQLVLLLDLAFYVSCFTFGGYMEGNFGRAALESLKKSGQFNDAQSQAIAQAIDEAFGQLHVYVDIPRQSVVLPHSHTLEETNGHTHKLSS